MTMVASARVPDGVVIATDSFASLHGQVEGSAIAKVSCPECGHEHQVKVQLPTMPGAGIMSSLPNSQKLLPLFGTFGVGLFGQSIFGQRTVYSLVREFEEKHKAAPLKEIKKAAQSLGRWFNTVLKNSLPKERKLSDIPPNAHVMGFQLVGHDAGAPTTVVVYVGGKFRTETYGEFGVTVNGEKDVVTKLWELPGADARHQTPYPAMSIQDAVEYVDFLISTTATHQRFATMIPTVGGDIDVGVILRSGGFKWYRQKPLSKLLFGDGPFDKD